MTRGKIQYIEKDLTVYTTIEFNGDMYPTGHGDEIIDRFEIGGFSDRADYEKFAARFDKRNFGYTNNVRGTFYILGEYNEDDFEFNDHHTDYIYIINGSGRDVAVRSRKNKEESGEKVILPSGCMAILNYFEVEKILRRKNKG